MTSGPGAASLPAEERARQVLDLLKERLELTDQEIATRSGFASHQVVQMRRTGQRRITLSDVERFAGGLAVPPLLFLMPLSDAEAWLNRRHRRHKPIRSMNYALIEVAA